MTQTFLLPEADAGLCNAVRRSLMSDVRAWAPSRITVRKNTSCQTDEFLAHRIGLIPFRRVGNGDTMELRVEGPRVANAEDFVGPAFDVVHGNIPLMVLADQRQALDLTVHFEEQLASTHARFCKCAGVGMRRCDEGHALSFHTVDGSEEKITLLEAIDALIHRLDSALQSLAHQPKQLPESM